MCRLWETTLRLTTSVQLKCARSCLRLLGWSRVMLVYCRYVHYHTGTYYVRYICDDHRHHFCHIQAVHNPRQWMDR